MWKVVDNEMGIVEVVSNILADLAITATNMDYDVSGLVDG